jgi:hypothetical protein
MPRFAPYRMPTFLLKLLGKRSTRKGASGASRSSAVTCRKVDAVHFDGR